MDAHHTFCKPLLGALIRLAVALSLSALVLSPRTLMAQSAPAQQTQTAPAAQADSDDDEFFGDAHRRRIYEQSRLSATTAVLYNLAVPGMGNVYAEQYFYGGIAFSLMVFTVVFAGYGLATEQSEFLWMGAGTAGLAYTGSIVTSVMGVRDYNRKLRQGLKLEGAFSAGGPDLPKAWGVEVGFRF